MGHPTSDSRLRTEKPTARLAWASARVHSWPELSSNLNFVSAATAAIGGALIPVPGGLLAKDADGVIVGAVGVTGDTSDNDEVCGLAGITAAGLTAETG